MTELTTRTYADADAGPIADLMNVIETATGADPGFTEGEIRANMAGWITDHGHNTRLIVTPDGALVAVGMVAAPPPGGQRADTFGGVHPEWLGRGLGRELLGWQLDRVAAIYAERAPETSWHVETGTNVNDDAAIRLFERFGMKPVRYFFEMLANTADAPAVPTPAGLRIAAFTDDLTKPVYDAHMEAFADHWGFQKRPFDDWFKMTLGSTEFRGDLSRIAFDGEEIAGYVLSYDGADERHYIGQVGTRRPWRKRGLASAMMADSLAAAAAAGKTVSMLGVDADSPTGAVGVYERLGFAEHAKFVAYRRYLDA